jgi:hypothetical protein
MSRRTRLVLALLPSLAAWLLAGPVHAAQGVSIAWDHCLAQGTGVQNRNFACDTNSGQERLVGAFRLDQPMSNMIGAEIVIQLAAANATLPSWWTYWYAGSCRQTSLSVNSNADALDTACPDWSNGLMFVGIGTYCTSTGSCVDRPSSANEARLKLVEAVPQQNPMPVNGGQDYFVFNLVIDHAGTVGAGACAGCDIPVCLVLNSIDVIAIGNVEHRLLTLPSAPGSNFATWQGGGVPVAGGGTGCPAATAARHSTWGAVKSLYR